MVVLSKKTTKTNSNSSSTLLAPNYSTLPKTPFSSSAHHLRSLSRLYTSSTSHPSRSSRSYRRPVAYNERLTLGQYANTKDGRERGTQITRVATTTTTTTLYRTTQEISHSLVFVSHQDISDPKDGVFECIFNHRHCVFLHRAAVVVVLVAVFSKIRFERNAQTQTQREGERNSRPNDDAPFPLTPV